ncbi:hypothetical protein EXIGLDRAFT_743521 [Exidia glandulosa HHB12029]|uniref:N-acetyltransferase domain-containing protein n=1 Tax=Exidia glandulosa HHB12029 TaxID=1314781 RepID=A0A165QMF7_EXIGL|nr:hypothetical protein EXIGLDRAFT_743521 [Exidia glandulosa HHB12029]
MSSHVYHTVSHAALDYRALVAHLSRPELWPSTLHVRNQLLSPFGTRHFQQQNHDVQVDEDPWTTYLRHRPGAQVHAIGDIPRDVLRQPGGAGGATGAWALVLLYEFKPSGLAMGGSSASDVQYDGAANMSSPRVTMWLSTEASSPSPAEDALLRYIVLTHLPRAVADMGAAPGGLMRICGSHAGIVTRIQRWGSESGVDVQWNDVCVTYIRDENSETPSPPSQAARWIIGSLEREEDVKLVRDANTFGFPSWYIASRAHLSILLWDRQGDSAESETATRRYKGAAAGWSYAHEDFSVGSFYITPPYRRLGLGQLVLSIIEEKFVGAQTLALEQVGLSALPGPFFLNTEEGNASARALFEKCGLRDVRRTIWAGIVVKVASVTSSPSQD